MPLNIQPNVVVTPEYLEKLRFQRLLEEAQLRKLQQDPLFEQQRLAMDQQRLRTDAQARQDQLDLGRSGLEETTKYHTGELGIRERALQSEDTRAKMATDAQLTEHAAALLSNPATMADPQAKQALTAFFAARGVPEATKFNTPAAPDPINARLAEKLGVPTTSTPSAQTNDVESLRKRFAEVDQRAGITSVNPTPAPAQLSVTNPAAFVTPPTTPVAATPSPYDWNVRPGGSLFADWLAEMRKRREQPTNYTALLNRY